MGPTCQVHLVLLFIKNLMLQIVIYKKLNFWEEYTPLSFLVMVIQFERNCAKRSPKLVM